MQLAQIATMLAFLAWAALAAAAARQEVPAREPAEQPTSAVEIMDESFKAVVSPDAQVRRLADGLRFTEGPTWYAAEECLLFSDIPANRIYRWTQADGLKVWREPSNNSNGLTVDGQGRLIACEHGSRSVTRTGKDGKVETLASTYKSKKLNSPNDVVVKRDGTIWFTDPPYGIKAEQVEQDANYVFRLDVGAKEPVAVASDFARPNGLCFSPDEKYLYVADSDGKKRHIRRFAVKADNTLDGGEVFAAISPGGPDGIRCDGQGRVFSSAGDGVHVFSPAGKLIGKIRTPESPANLCFGGPDMRTLFITARTGLYAVTLLAPAGK